MLITLTKDKRLIKTKTDQRLIFTSEGHNLLFLRESCQVRWIDLMWEEVESNCVKKKRRKKEMICVSEILHVLSILNQIFQT